MITVGIDIGSISAKAAVMRNGELIATCLQLTGYNARQAGLEVFRQALSDGGIAADAVERVVSTGYGRNRVDFAHRVITEITCHAAGVHFLTPGTRGIIDIGGQDSKVIAVDQKGRVADFVMNDKCAAGTGRFLEVMARALEVDLNDFGQMSGASLAPSAISSLCTVFAESEVISLIARGEARENIIAGLHEAVAARVAAMAARVRLSSPVVMTGGVARNSGVVKALEKKLGLSIGVSPFAQVNGAIGAALLAGETV